MNPDRAERQKKFLAINHEHLKQARLTSDDEYVDSLMPCLEARGLVVDKATVKPAIFAVRDRARTYVEAADGLDFFFRDPPTMDAAAQTKFLVPASATHLRGYVRMLEEVSTWTEAELERRTHVWLEEKGITIKDLAQPARVALTGRTASPGLYQVLFVLGKARSLERLGRAAAVAEGGAVMPKKS